MRNLSTLSSHAVTSSICRTIQVNHFYGHRCCVILCCWLRKLFVDGKEERLSCLLFILDTFTFSCLLSSVTYLSSWCITLLLYIKRVPFQSSCVHYLLRYSVAYCAIPSLCYQKCASSCRALISIHRLHCSFHWFNMFPSSSFTFFSDIVLPYNSPSAFSSQPSTSIRFTLPHSPWLPLLTACVSRLSVLPTHLPCLSLCCSVKSVMSRKPFSPQAETNYCMTALSRFSSVLQVPHYIVVLSDIPTNCSSSNLSLIQNLVLWDSVKLSFYS